MALIGIGHTRWATHGRPTEENAHPHRDCTGRIVVVHNGIVENYLALKKELIAEGHKFVTETDTEIIAHLIEQEIRSAAGSGKTLSLEDAVRRAVRRLTGAFALGVISADEPDKIVVARNGPPAVVGVGEGEYFVASDVPGISAPHPQYLLPRRWRHGHPHPRGVTLTDFHGKPIKRDVTRVLWDPIQAEKGGYKHFMLKEILEQPRAIRDTTLGRISLDTGTVLPERDGDLRRRISCRIGNQHRSLRHQLARGACRQVHDRAAGARAGRCRLCERVSLPRSDRRSQAPSVC